MITDGQLRVMPGAKVDVTGAKQPPARDKGPMTSGTPPRAACAGPRRLNA